MNAGLVSVIIPNYNYGSWIAETVNSVLSQSYDIIEVILVDDASTDDSVAVIRELENASKDIKVIFLDTNVGVSGALKKGLEIANGEYVCFLASDDLILPEKLEGQVKLLNENTQYAAVSGCYATIDRYGRLSENRIEGFKKVPIERRTSAIFGCVFHACTALFRREAIDDVGGFRAGIKYEDWYMQLLLEQSGYEFLHVNSLSVLKRDHGGNSHFEYEKSIKDKLYIASLFPNCESMIRVSALRQEQIKIIKHGSLSLFAKLTIELWRENFSTVLLNQLIKAVLLRLVRGP